MDKRFLTCCFTGHRILPVGIEDALWQQVYQYLQPLLAQGIRYFGLGGALGFDMLMAERLLLLREHNPQIKVILALPFHGYQSRWTFSQQTRAACIERQTDKIVYCCKTSSREAFLSQDRHLVDHSAYCIAYCTRSAGGTVYTLKYAQQQGLQIWNVASTWPSPYQAKE